VEQEVAGDDTPVIQAVLECDVERAALLREEAELMAALGVSVRARVCARVSVCVCASVCVCVCVCVRVCCFV
jgi:hypothetical protein